MIISWTNGHAARLREFLGTETGSLLMHGLRSHANQMPDGKTLEEEAMLSRQTKGFHNAIKVIEQAAEWNELPEQQPTDIDLEKAIE